MTETKKGSKKTYKCSKIVAFAPERMAQPYVTLEIVGVEHQGASAILQKSNAKRNYTRLEEKQVCKDLKKVSGVIKKDLEDGSYV